LFVSDRFFHSAQIGVGAGEACDLLILPLHRKIKIKRSQPAAAPTGAVIHPMERCWLASLETTGPIVQAAHWQ
jgi:hypothetical protein